MQRWQLVPRNQLLSFARKKMDPLKDPTTYSWITYAWVVVLSAFGGLVSFARKVTGGKSHTWNLTEFIGDIATSAFGGLITFYMCEAAKIDPLWTAAMVGISGHMGSRALFQAELILRNKYPRVSDAEEVRAKSDDDKPK